MIYDLNGHFNYLHAKTICPKDTFEVKGKAIDLAKGKDLLCSLSRKRLATALGVGKLKSADDRKHLNICFGSKLTNKGVSLIAVLGKVTGADDHIGIGICRKGVGNSLNNVASVSQICIGKHNHVALGGKHSGSNGISLAAVDLVANYANTRKIHFLNHLVASVL